jgi:hypothetical protein
MARYALIVDNMIVETHDSIPNNWRNISGFNLMTENEHREHGFYKIRETDVVYNPVRHNLITNEIKLDVDGLPFVDFVVENKMTDEEYQTFLFEESLSILKNIRDSYLNSSDWALTVDVVELKGEEWKTSWTNYRQQLRDLTEPFKQSRSNFNPYEVTLPTKPNF